MSLIYGWIAFHEAPNARNGQIIGYLAYVISSQIKRNVLVGTVDNGITPEYVSSVMLMFRYKAYKPLEVGIICSKSESPKSRTLTGMDKGPS